MKDKARVRPFEGVVPTNGLYVPPAGDEPLDDIELAVVRALVPIIVAKIREENAGNPQGTPVAMPARRAG